MNNYRVEGCVECNSCRLTNVCVLDDDFNSIVPKIKEADALVIASPLYFWTINTRLLAFVERFYSIAKKDVTQLFGGIRSMIRRTVLF